MALLGLIRSCCSGGACGVEPSPPRKVPSIGETLRRQRLASGVDVSEAARALKIKPAYLLAIEEDRPDRLPGAPYAVGFVRSYSSYLGLDSTALVRQFKAEWDELNAKPNLAFPMPASEGSLPTRRVLIVAVVLTVCSYAAWYRLNPAELRSPERVAELPPQLMASKSSAAAGLSATNAPTAARSAASDHPNPLQPAEPVTAQEAAQVPPADLSPPPNPALIGASAGASAEAAPHAAGGSAAALSRSEDRQHAYGVFNRKSRITLQAKTDSWIQIRASNHAVLFTGVLKTGESYAVPELPGLILRAGNAGGLGVVVDGKPGLPLGPMGAVRNVSLSPQSLTGDNAVHN